MRKFIYARNAADDTDTVIAVPFDTIRSMHLFSATSLRLQIVGDDAGLGTIRVGITEGKEVEVMKAIVNSQRASRNSFVDLGDDTSSEYLHEHITDISTLSYTS